MCYVMRGAFSLKDKRHRVFVLVAFYAERCSKLLSHSPFVCLMAFETGNVHVLVMSADCLLIGMTVTEAVNGRRLQFSVGLVAVLAVNRAHGRPLGYVFMAFHALLFFRRRSILTVDMTA